MTDHPTLFDAVDDQLRELDALPDPGRFMLGQHHHAAGDTEVASAMRITPRAGTWRRRVLDAIARAGARGLTDWEIHTELGGNLYTVAPRRVELMRDGWIADSGVRRETNSGSRAAVWILTEAGREQWSRGAA